MDDCINENLEARLCKNIFCLLPFLLIRATTAELLVASLKECDRVRCITAHAAGLKGGGGWRLEGSESIGSNKQPTPILKGWKSWKGFIGTIKKT